MTAHVLKPHEGPHNTFRCILCGVTLSGLTVRDRLLMETDGLGRCPVNDPMNPAVSEETRAWMRSLRDSPDPPMLKIDRDRLLPRRG